MTQGGLYQKWLEVATHGVLHKVVKEPQVAFEVAKVRDFEGPVYFSIIGLLLAVASLAFEYVLNLKFRKQQIRKQSYIPTERQQTRKQSYIPTERIGVKRRGHKRLFDVRNENPRVYW